METLSPDMITQIYSSTSLGVSIMLAAAGLGSALGWGLICMKYIEGIARQPEMLPALENSNVYNSWTYGIIPIYRSCFCYVLCVCEPICWSSKSCTWSIGS